MRIKLLSRLFATIVLLPVVSASVSADTDFFESKIAQVQSKETAKNLFSGIELRNISLRSVTEKNRFSDMQFFLAQTKKEAENRYSAGEINRYEIQDIRNELSYLVHSMNEYFTNVRSFERSSNPVYKKLATQNLSDAKTTYDRLKATTRRSVR